MNQSEPSIFDVLKFIYKIYRGRKLLIYLLSIFVALPTFFWVNFLASLGAIFILLAFLSIGCLFAYGPSTSNAPRYLKWYKLPFPWRKILWDFGTLAMHGTGSGYDKIIYISGFQAWMKVQNKKGIHPKKAILKSINTGGEYPLLFDTDKGYRAVENINTIPSGKWHRVIMNLSNDSVSVDAFLNELDGWNLIFEYEEGKFEREFSSFEVRHLIARFRNDGFYKSNIYIKANH